MVIEQSLGIAWRLLDEELIEMCKRDIQKIEHSDPAVRDLVLKKVAASNKLTDEEKREEGLQQVMKENISFAIAVGLQLHELLWQFG